MTGKVDWSKAAELPSKELDRLLAEDHDDIDDNPELTDAELTELRPASEVLPTKLYEAVSSRRPGERGPGKKPAKALLTLRVDSAALEAWKASGDGWRSRINDLVVREANRLKKRA